MSLEANKRDDYATLVMAMTQDYLLGKISWHHWVCTVRFTAQTVYDLEKPEHDPYLPAAPPEPLPQEGRPRG